MWLFTVVAAGGGGEGELEGGNLTFPAALTSAWLARW